MAHGCGEIHAAVPRGLGELMRTNLCTKESCQVYVYSWFGDYHHGLWIRLMFI